MVYFCTIYTEGGPVVVLPHAQLQRWDGDRDYGRAISVPTPGSVAVLPNYRNAFPLCIMGQESDGNFHIFCSRTAICVLSEIYADKGHELRRKLPSIRSWTTDTAPIGLEFPDERVVILDAALAGSRVHLVGMGFERILYDDCIADHESAAVLAIVPGKWEALELRTETENLCASGLLLRKLRA